MQFLTCETREKGVWLPLVRADSDTIRGEGVRVRMGLSFTWGVTKFSGPRQKLLGGP